MATGQEPNATPAIESPTPAPTAGADAKTGQAPETERFDAEYVKQLRAEAASTRVKLRELETRFKAEEDAKLSELEREKKARTELESKLQALENERKQSALRFSVTSTAQKLGIVDTDAAMKLMDADKLTYNETGEPVNVEAALRELVKARPWLVSPASTASATNPQRGGKSTITKAQLAAMTPEQINANWDAVQALLAGTQ